MKESKGDQCIMESKFIEGMKTESQGDTWIKASKCLEGRKTEYQGDQWIMTSKCLEGMHKCAKLQYCSSFPLKVR